MIRFSPPPPFVRALSLRKRAQARRIPLSEALQNWFWRRHSTVRPLPKIVRYVFPPPFAIAQPGAPQGGASLAPLRRLILSGSLQYGFRESTVSNAKLSGFFGPHRVPGRKLSELFSAYDLGAKANSPRFSQNSPIEFQRTKKGASGKGPYPKTSKIVKECQGVSRHFSTLLTQGKHASTLFDNFRVAPVFRPLLGGGL